MGEAAFPQPGHASPNYGRVIKVKFESKFEELQSKVIWPRGIFPGYRVWHRKCENFIERACLNARKSNYTRITAKSKYQNVSSIFALHVQPRYTGQYRSCENIITLWVTRLQICKLILPAQGGYFEGKYPNLTYLLKDRTENILAMEAFAHSSDHRLPKLFIESKKGTSYDSASADAIILKCGLNVKAGY